MAYIQGEARSQGTLFPVVLDDLVPSDHMCHMIDAFSGSSTWKSLGFDRAQPAETYLCPGEKTLKRKVRLKKDKSIIYLANAKDCCGCSLKLRCTASTARRVSRHVFEDALTRMNARATATAMRLRRSVVEHPFATIKFRILGHPRLLLSGQKGARTESSLAVMAYNLKRMANVLGTTHLAKVLHQI